MDALKNRQKLNDILESLRQRGLKPADIVELQSVACYLPVREVDNDHSSLEKEMLKISERERQQVSHDLHDDLGQLLVGIEALSTILEQRLEQNANPEIKLSREISNLIRNAISKTRSLAKELCPVLDEGGLVPALREYAAENEKLFGITCRLECDKSIMIDDYNAATHIYHIVHESVDNAIRHGEASEVIIRLSVDGEELTLLICDNGKGLPERLEEKKGLGINIMEYRAKKIGAELTIFRNENNQSIVQCVLKRSQCSYHY